MSMRIEAPPEMHNKWLAERFNDKEFADARFVVIEHGEAGAVAVDSDSAFPLLYLAKKYLVGGLVSLVLQFLQSSVNETNVAQLVLHGQNYLDDAPDTFWSCIEGNARPLVESEEFLVLTKPSVAALLHRNLDVDETAIFKRVVATALPLTPGNIRSALDGLVRLVRFPLMPSKSFTVGPAKSGLLTQDELMDIFPWFTAKVTPTLFSTAQRAYVPPASAQTYVCDRLTSTSGSWNCAGFTEAIELKVNRSITIIGVGIWGLSGDGPAEYTISFELHASGKTQAKEVATVTSTGGEPIMVINFAKPVRVLADSVYTVTAQITGPPTRRGIGGFARRAVQTSKGAVKFSFSESSMSTIQDNITYGLLPQIMFRV